MTSTETAFAEDLFSLLRKYNIMLPVTSLPKTGKKWLISMIGFNNLQLSKYCVESVLANSTPGLYELRLTNNGSKDGTMEYFDQMQGQFPQITVTHNAENEGFQKPNEEAFQYAVKNGFELMVMLNNDAEVPAGWLEKLAEPFSNPKCAIAGPLGGCSRLNEDMNGCDDTKLEFIEGSCAAVSVEIFQREWGRLFAPWLSFIYSEDALMSLRAQYAGYEIKKVAFRIKHRGSQTAGAHPEAKKKCAEANLRNREQMKIRFKHWNKFRRFDHQIVVRREYAVGDVLLTTPIIRALANKYRLCPIYVETGAPDIFKHNPRVKLAAPKIVIEKDAMVIDLNNSYERTPGRHVLESYAEAAGLEAYEWTKKMEIYGWNDDKPKNDRWCAVHIGPTTWPGKNWPNERWNQVIQAIRARGYKVMLFGNPPKDAQFLVEKDCRGQSGIQEFSGLLAQSSLFVGPDSFPAHLSAALEIPAVVLYGITDPKCFATYTGKYVAVTSDPKHPDTGRRNREAGKTFIPSTDAVMRTISVDDVMRAVDTILV